MMHFETLNVRNVHTVFEYLSCGPCQIELASQLPRCLTRFSSLATLCLAIGLSSGVLEARATTYYVDPTAGNDSNAGTSQMAPWKTIMGTRTTDNSDFLHRSWGSIVKDGPLIQPGDIIEIKAGTSMTSAEGGRLYIDGSFYENGNAQNPIVIRVSSNWGSGDFTYNATGMTIPVYQPAVAIDRRDYIQIRGADANRRFSIINASGGGWGIIANGASGTKQVGVVLDYLELANNSYGGSSISYSDNWTISNSIAHNNGSIGFDTGGLNDQTADNGLYSNDEAYNNGLDPQGGIAHGYGLYASTNITFLRCISHDNVRDGFDFGTVSNTNSSSATVIDSASYDNGEDGFGANGGKAGTQTFNYINVISFNNSMSGWQIYDGAKVGIYYSIAHSNGVHSSFGGNILTYAGEGFPPPTITLRNNIFYKPKAYAQISSYRSSGGSPIISSNNNIYVPRSSDNEVGFEFPWHTEHSYTTPPSFIGADDKLGTDYDPGFVSASSITDFLANDYHLASPESPAVHSGALFSSITLDAELLDALTKDQDGKTRSSPPDIGNFHCTAVSKLATPLNIRLILR
jgi:hypothetical protein